MSNQLGGGGAYELIDFGDGRKLESIGGYLIDRPSPAAAEISVSTPAMWRDVDAYFDEVAGRWLMHRPWPTDAFIDAGPFRLPTRPTPFGHIGVFPEQRPQWQWLAETVTAMLSPGPVQALNLFAYTGGSTLAMAAAGASVAHVDAAKPNVTTARAAAQVSGMQEAPIRYLVDDAMKFTAREVRRGRTYQIVVLDPPAYGHSPDGKAWRIERDVWPMIDEVLRLFGDGRGAVLFTCHSETVTAPNVADYFHNHPTLRDVRDALQLTYDRSPLTDRNHRKLDAGYHVRLTWP